MKPARASVAALFAVALVLAPIGCAQDGRGEFVQAAEEHALEDQPTPEKRAERATEPPEIFYDLTRYEWYRRGEPLLVDGWAYQPTGRPEATMARRFESAGRFEGVTYYVREGTTPPYDIVYVPVSRGYWQPFAPVSPIIPQPIPEQTGEAD